MNQVDDLDVQRFLQRFEHEIVNVNRKHIGEITGEINKQDVLKIGESVSICRANYLKSVLEMARNDDVSQVVVRAGDAKRQRLLYEETMAGFAALRHALERGYVVVNDD